MRMLNMATTHSSTSSSSTSTNGTLIIMPYGGLNADVSLFSRINKVEHNFNVSIVLFSKYTRLFSHLIGDTTQCCYDNDDSLSNTSSDLGHKSKKLRSNSAETGLVVDHGRRFITCFDLFKFGWIFYIYIKGKFHSHNY